MHAPADSFQRSAGLEFVRSTHLERGNAPANNIASVTVTVNNGIQGYYGPGADRWILYPTLRVRAAVAGESRELTWNFIPWPNIQNAFLPPAQLGTPFQIIVSESAGWSALNRGSIGNPIEISRTPTTSVVRYGTQLGDEIVTRTVEGTPFDARAYRDLFWNACIASQGIWPQAPQAANPVLFYQIRADGALVPGTVLPGTFPPASIIQVRTFDLQAAGFDEMSEAFRSVIWLRFTRRRNAFDPAGEAVYGAFADFDFDGISTPFDCRRGITEAIEDVVPPRIPQATLDAISLDAIPLFATLTRLATSERRLIPPDPPHPLITC